VSLVAPSWAERKTKDAPYDAHCKSLPFFLTHLAIVIYGGRQFWLVALSLREKREVLHGAAGAVQHLLCVSIKKLHRGVI
jgi:hypothetical protein